MFFFTVYFEQCTPEHSVPCNSALLLCAMIYAHCAAIYRENHENQKIRNKIQGLHQVWTNEKTGMGQRKLNYDQ